jgi:hypothetical protein
MRCCRRRSSMSCRSHCGRRRRARTPRCVPRRSDRSLQFFSAAARNGDDSIVRGCESAAHRKPKPAAAAGHDDVLHWPLSSLPKSAASSGVILANCPAELNGDPARQTKRASTFYESSQLIDPPGQLVLAGRRRGHLARAGGPTAAAARRSRAPRASRSEAKAGVCRRGRFRGLIGVQVHVGPPMKIEYRHILVKTLNWRSVTFIYRLYWRL